MYDIKVLKSATGPYANVEPLSAKRDWMDENFYSYNCFPITVTNKMGWGISFDEDISFIWDGTTKPGHDTGITILSGSKYCYLNRGGGVIGFLTGLVFMTEEDVNLLTIPVPNQLIDGVQCLTTITNTSFYTGPLHVAWRVTRPNEVITIKSGTPVASIVPLEPALINNSTISYADEFVGEFHHGLEYVTALTEYGKEHQKTANWYREGVNEKGDKIGKHPVKVFNFEPLEEKS